MRLPTAPITTAGLALLALTSPTAHAQPELTRFVLPGGGGTMSAPDTRAVVAFGQPLVMASTAGPAKLELGFYPQGDCVADFNDDGVLNFFDVSAFISAFTGMDPSADLTGDGVLNFFDVSAFIGVFAGGCP